MRVICPKCEESFNAKVNARRLKCPACGFREDAPPEGFAAVFATGKRRTDGFTPVEQRSGSSGSSATPWIVLGVVALLAVGAAAWYFTSDDDPPADNGTGQGNTTANPMVLIRTSEGDMTAELYPAKSPKTVENFLAYVRECYYADLQFYRIVPGFVNQGGGESTGKTGSRPPVQNEAASSGLSNTKYTLAMARTNDPHSATTEFFINAADNVAGNPNNLDPGGVSPDGYTVFGKLVSGLEVSDRINAHQGPSPTFSIMELKDGQVVKPCGSTPGGSTPTTTSRPPPVPCASLPNASPVGMSSPGVHIDLITPGVWNVCGSTTDMMYVWIHNGSPSAIPYTWRITGEGGAPLPAGWSVSFQKPSGNLEASAGSPGKAPYADWAATLVTLTLPADQPAGDVKAELHAAGTTRAFTFHVQAPRGTVSKPGDQVTTCYDLKGSDGRDIQKGPFPLQVAGGGAVPGYANGVAGVAQGETVTLVVPPPFAYGANGMGSDIKPWETLTWAATIVTDPNTCPR